jgi:hypothetical protein
MFIENLSILKRLNPALAEKFDAFYIQALRLTKTRKGEFNAQFFSKGRKIFLYSNYDIKKEMTKWVESLNLSKIEVLVVYGLGLGHSFQAFRPWLEEDSRRSLVYLENELEIFRTFLEMPHAKEIMSHPQVETVFFDETSVEDICKKTGNTCSGRSYLLEIAKSYKLLKAEIFTTLKEKIQLQVTFLSSVQSTLGEVSKTSYPHNFYSKVLQKCSPQRTPNLFGRFLNIPAIICAAGPSLNENLHVLKNLQKHAVIIAGKSTVNFLHSIGVKPHFSGFEDQLSLPKNVSKVDLAEDAVNRVNSWLERRLGEKQELPQRRGDTLYSLTEMACKMACSPIIFVGMDQAFTKNQLLPEFPKRYPQIQFINVTKGDKEFEGIATQSLQEVADKHLQQKYNIQELLLTSS